MKINFYLRRIGFFAIVLLMAGIFGCGGASPPAGIPAPVSQAVSVSAPDVNNEVSVTGAPGAVDPSVTVRAANISQGGVVKMFQKFFIGTAFAQMAPIEIEITSEIDGSFFFRLFALAGDTIRIVVRVGDLESPPLDLVVPELDLPF